MILSLGKGEYERKENLRLLVIPCKNAFDDIIRRSFLTSLDAIASTVHLKVTYDSDVGNPVVLDVDLNTTRLIYDTILRNILTTTSVSGKALRGFNLVDLDVREDEIRPVTNGDFELLHLDENPDR